VSAEDPDSTQSHQRRLPPLCAQLLPPLSAGGGFTRTGIGTIVDMDSLEVEVDVGEAYIGRVQPQIPWNYQRKHFDGIVPTDVTVI